MSKPSKSIKPCTASPPSEFHHTLEEAFPHTEGLHLKEILIATAKLQNRMIPLATSPVLMLCCVNSDCSRGLLLVHFGIELLGFCDIGLGA